VISLNYQFIIGISEKKGGRKGRDKAKTTYNS
jgi:hypothetical protein